MYFLEITPHLITTKSFVLHSFVNWCHELFFKINNENIDDRSQIKVHSDKRTHVHSAELPRWSPIQVLKVEKLF